MPSATTAVMEYWSLDLAADSYAIDYERLKLLIGEDRNAEHDEDGRDIEHQIADVGCWTFRKQRPANTLDQADHGIEVIKELVLFGNEARRIIHRRREHSELKRERQHHADVAIKRVQRRKPDADAKRREAHHRQK